MDADELGRMLRSGEIDESRILFAQHMNFDVPQGEDVTEYMKYYNDTVMPRLMILKQAHLRFDMLAKAYGNSNLEYERYYRNLYDDIVEHREVWFNTIFSSDNPNANPVHAERTTGILGTLCTILRQRGDLKGCMEVMETYMAVLERYQAMSAEDVCDSPAQIACCEGLTYRCNLIRINCGMQLPDEDMAVKAFRAVVAYEKKQKALGQYDCDAMPDYDGVMAVFFGHDRYDEVSNADIIKALSFWGKNQDPAPAGELRKCGRCDKEEAMFGDYKKCSRCHEQPYCSRDCQADDWAIHKHLCDKRNTTNLPSKDLLDVAKLVTTNHALTVEEYTGRTVPACQQKDALAKLVKHLKLLLTGDFQRFNSIHAAGDAGSDAAFNAALADFFAEQPGFKEVWSKLRVGYKEAWEKQQEEERRSGNGLNIDEDSIRKLCNSLAQTLIIQFGAMMPAGHSDILDGKKRDKLLDDLVELVTIFAIENPEYNSNLGLVDMINNDDFKARMASTVSNAMEIELAD